MKVHCLKKKSIWIIHYEHKVAIMQRHICTVCATKSSMVTFDVEYNRVAKVTET